MQPNNNYMVYMHTNTINNKKYVGITFHKNPNRRWGNGEGYKQQKRFYAAIKRYGWYSFVHEIIFDNLTETEAKSLEIKLIAEYNLTDPNYGYNVSIGGDGYHKYETEEEAHEVYLARQKRIHNNRKLDPEKNLKDKESNKRSREAIYADPVKKQQYIEKCLENYRTRYNTEEGKAKIKESKARSQHKLKQIRSTLRELYKNYPSLFTDEQYAMALGRNEKHRYQCHSIKKLSEVLCFVQQKLEQTYKIA